MGSIYDPPLAHVVLGLAGGAMPKARATMMQWSANKPTVPGYWWFRTPTHAPEVCRVKLYGQGYDPEWMAYFTDGERNTIVELTEFEWAGPLEPPR